MDENRTNLRVALIMGASTLAVAFVLYTVFVGYVNRPNPAALQAEALLAEPQAKEYEGESSLIQAKANLVSAYPGTITAAGETALQFGLGLFLALIGLGAAYLIFSIGTSFMMRSSANAYRDVNAVRVLPKLQNDNESVGWITSGVAGNGGIHSEDVGIAPESASSLAGGTDPKSPGKGNTAGGGGADGAAKRYSKRGAKKGKV